MKFRLIWLLPVAAATGLAQDPFPRAVEDAQQLMEDAQQRVRDSEQRIRDSEQRMLDAQQRLKDFNFDGKWELAGNAFKLQSQIDMLAQAAPKPSTIYVGRRKSSDSDERIYDSGTRALDSNRWEDAVRDFTEAADRKGSHADGALYWKAYSENRLGQRDTALATIAVLRRDYPSSRWLNDAQALEVEIRQQSGKPVNPDTESNEDLKMLALNGLLHSDPDQALPIIDKLLKSNNSPKLKDRALFVLTQSGTPKAQQMLLGIAKGGANPDMQLRAIKYIASSGSKESKQELLNIYSSTSDVNVKRAILRYYLSSQGSGTPDGLINIAKTEKDAALRKEAVRTLGVMQPSQTGDALIAMYSSEQDPEIKREISSGLYNQRNAKGLVDLARKESNPQMKQDIVQKLSTMRSKEATDYLMELLNK